MVRYSGCLDNLSSARRRVLELRAGVGAADPRSRRGVARELDISVQRVRRLERGGLRRVRLLVRTDGCGGSLAGSEPAASASGTPVLSAGSLSGPDAGGGGSTSGGDASGGGGSGSDSGSGSSPNGSGDVRGESATQPPPAFGGAPRDITTGTSLWIALTLIALAGLAGFATPSLRDRLRSASGAR